MADKQLEVDTNAPKPPELMSVIAHRSYLDVFISGTPTEPDEQCVFREHFVRRIKEWKGFQRFSLFLFFIILVLISALFLESTKEQHFQLFIAGFVVLTAMSGFWLHSWYKVEQLFRYLVESCTEWLRRLALGMAVEEFINSTGDKIREGRLT